MVKEKSKVRFHLLHKFQLKNRRDLKNFILEIFKSERKQVGEIDFIFCNDEYLLQINRQFLNHDFYTDIITFPLHKESEPIKADIFISIERLKENSKNLKLSFNEELVRVIIHGVLHLCGFKDKSKIEILDMRSSEDKYLKKLVSRETKKA